MISTFRLRAIVCACVSLTANVSYADDRTSQNTPLAIVGGTILDMKDGARMRDSTIIIKGNRIVDVGPTSGLPIPEDTTVIDARGKWIIPGLTDMHAHVTAVEFPLSLYVAAGVTTVRDPGGNVTTLRLMQNAILRDERIGPRLFYCGPVLDGSPPTWPDSSVLVETMSQAETVVPFLVAQGADCIKSYNSIQRGILDTLVQVSSASGVPLIGHIPRSLTMTEAVESGLRHLEHIRITAREVLDNDLANDIDFLPVGQREPLLWNHIDLDSPKIARLVSLLAAHDVVLDPTLSIDERLFVITAQEERAHRDNSIVPDETIEQWKDIWSADILQVPKELREVAREGFEKRKRFVKMCSDAGVLIVAGTDGPALGTLLPGLGLHHELLLLVEAGLSRLQALQAATVNAATALGQNDIGLLAPGYLADLVILEEDPLADIRNTRRISTVIKDGEVQSVSLSDWRDQSEIDSDAERAE